MSFLAGYDYGKDAGTVHVANRHIVPGKKFFLWGNNANGEMWNKILSDNDGHYLELMVGGYSDNQPDYSWINPGEIREFSQIWYPIKGIKGVKNATKDAAVNFEPTEGNNYRIGYCTTTSYKNARVVVKYKNQIILDKQVNIDPDKYFLDQIAVPDSLIPSMLYTALYDAKDNLLVDYRPIVQEEKKLPKSYRRNQTCQRIQNKRRTLSGRSSHRTRFNNCPSGLYGFTTRLFYVTQGCTCKHRNRKTLYSPGKVGKSRTAPITCSGTLVPRLYNGKEYRSPLLSGVFISNDRQDQ